MTTSPTAASRDVRPLSPLKKALFTLGLLLLVLGVFECGLRCTDIGRPAEKLWFKTATDWGTCYSEDEAGYFPLSIRESPADRERLRRVLTSVQPHPALAEIKGPLGIEDLVRRAPHCIVYQTPKRREGFFPSRPRHVALVGDSFVYGEGVKDEDTLAHRLALGFADTNFLNWGMPGVDIAEALAFMTDRIKHQRGELNGVVYFFNLNDIFFEHSSHPDVDIDQETAFLYGFDRLGREPTFARRLVAASRVLSLAKALVLQRRRTRRMVRAFQERYGDRQEFTELADHLQKMVELASKRTVPFHVVIHPLLYKDPLGSYPFAGIHHQMLELCQDRHIHCVDAYPAFAGERSLDGFRVNAVDSHPNGRANKLVVDYLTTRAPELFR